MQRGTGRRYLTGLALLGLCLLFVPKTATATDWVVQTGRFPTDTPTLQLSQDFATFLTENGMQITVDTSASPDERATLLQKNSELHRLLDAARTAIETLEIDQAQKHLLSLKAELNALPFFTAQHAETAQTGFLLLGIAHHLLGINEKSVAFFQDALALNPNISLPQAYQNPTIQALFLQAKAASSGTKKNEATVQASPKTSTIFHNGVALGQSPIVVENLPLGIHFITATHPNFRSSTTQIAVTEKSNKSNVILKLHPLQEPLLPPTEPNQWFKKDCQLTPNSTFIYLHRTPDRVLLSHFNCSLGTLNKKLFPLSLAPGNAPPLQAMKRWLLQMQAAPTFPAPAESNSFTVLQFWTGTFLAVGLLATGGTLGYLAQQAETAYHRTGQDGLTLDHNKTTDQAEGHPIAVRGKALGLGADIAISLGLGTLITCILLEVLGDEAEIRTTSRTSVQSTNFEVSISF